jgi:hypothetical protein
MTATDVPRVAPAIEVTAPIREPHRFGLLSVANIVPQPEQRFELGVYWEPISCAPAGSIAGDCFDAAAVEEGEGEEGGEGGTAGYPLVAESGVGPVAYGDPFAVYGSYDCSAFSRSLDEAESRARQHLAAWEEIEVERAIAAGDRSNRSTFQGATVLGTGLEIVEGVALLEGHLGTEYGGLGVIHAPRSAVALGRRQHAWSRRTGANRLETELGNYVVGGAGYDLASVGPDGTPTPDGTAWLYATSIPVVRRSDVWVTPDPKFRPQVANNDVTVFAWRVYVVAWECVTAAVLVDTVGVGGEG